MIMIVIVIMSDYWCCVWLSLLLIVTTNLPNYFNWHSWLLLAHHWAPGQLRHRTKMRPKWNVPPTCWTRRVARKSWKNEWPRGKGSAENPSHRDPRKTMVPPEGETREGVHYRLICPSPYDGTNTAQFNSLFINFVVLFIASKTHVHASCKYNSL